MLTIDADGDGKIDFTGVPDQTFPFQYTASGTYTAQAYIDGVSVGTLTVVVIDVDLPGGIACEVNYQREKTIPVYPASQAESVSFTSGDSSVVAVAVAGTGNSGAVVQIEPLSRGELFIAARLGGNSGPIIAASRVNEFTLDIPALKSAVVNSAIDIGGTTVTMRPYVAGVTFDFRMFAHTATFAGGETTASVNTSDLDGTGQALFKQSADPTTGDNVGTYQLELDVPPGETMYCFNTTCFQDDPEQCSNSYNVNGTCCKFTPKDLTLCKGQYDCSGETGTLVIQVDADNGCDLNIAIVQGNKGLGPKFHTDSGSTICKNTTTAICKKGFVQVSPPVIAGNQEGSYDLVINGQTFYDVIHVVQKCCSCSAQACCLCVDSQNESGLIFSLLSSDGSTHPGPFTVKIRDQNGHGPTFLDGSREDTIDVCPTPKPKVYTILGGDTPGSYDVIVQFGSDSSDFSVCTSICVFPAPPENLGSFQNITGSLSRPANYNTPEGQAQAHIAGGDPLGPTAKPYFGRSCGVSGGSTIGPPIAGTPYNQMNLQIGNTTITGYTWVGNDSTVPPETYPGTTVPPPDGKRYSSVYDDCGNRIETFCINGDHFSVYFVDCQNNYYLIGQCRLLNADNVYKVTYTQQCGKQRFGIVLMLNQDRDSILPGSDPQNPVYLIFNVYAFNTCSLTREASKHVNNINGSLSFISGISEGKVAPVNGPPPPQK